MPPQTLFVINDAPRKTLSRELCVWLQHMGAWPHVRFQDAGQRHEDCQYNTSIRDALALAEYDEFVFADCDIRPDAVHTREFLACGADVVGVRYPVEKDTAWDDPAVIHAGLWRTRREVLQEIAAPWFLWQYDAAHTRVTMCPCEYFSRKAAAAGFSVAQAGYALHEVRNAKLHS